MVLLGEGPTHRNKVAVTLLSNASLSSHPNNTLTRFTNVLRRPIEVDPAGGGVVSVRMKQIFFSRALAPALAHVARVPLMEIHLDQLQPQMVNGCNAPLLATVDVGRARMAPPTLGGNYVCVSFAKAPALKLNVDCVEHLSVRLTKSGGRVSYPLVFGPPTIVQLEIAMGSDVEFAMTCMSHPPTLGGGAEEEVLFADNTPTDFRTDLRRDVNLRGWEVALTSIAFPRFASDTQLLRIIVSLVVNEGEGAPAEPSPHSLTFAAPIGEFNDRGAFLTSFQHEVEVKDGFRDGPRGLVEVRRAVGNWNGRVIWNKHQERYLRVDFEPLAAYVCGWGFSRRVAFVPPATLNDGNLTARMTEITSPANSHLVDATALLPPDVCLAYCDRIKPIMVGDAQAHLLAPIPMQWGAGAAGGRAAHVVYEPPHLTYHDVQEGDFGDIGFTLRRADGQTVSFPPVREGQYGIDGGTIVTLRFRPKKSPLFRDQVLMRHIQAGDDSAGGRKRPWTTSFGDKKLFPSGPEGYDD